MPFGKVICGYVNVDALYHDPDINSEERTEIENEMKEYYLGEIRKFLHGAFNIKPFYDAYNKAQYERWKDINPRMYHPITETETGVEAFISFARTGFLGKTIETIWEMFNEDFDEMPTYINSEYPVVKAAAEFRLKIGK